MCELVRPCKRINSICLGKSQCGLDWSCGRTDGHRWVLAARDRGTRAWGETGPQGRAWEVSGTRPRFLGGVRSVHLKGDLSLLRGIVPGGCLTPWFSSFSQLQLLELGVGIRSKAVSWPWIYEVACQPELPEQGTEPKINSLLRQVVNRLVGATCNGWIACGRTAALWGLRLACFRSKSLSVYSVFFSVFQYSFFFFFNSGKIGI